MISGQVRMVKAGGHDKAKLFTTRQQRSQAQERSTGKEGVRDPTQTQVSHLHARGHTQKRPSLILQRKPKWIRLPVKYNCHRSEQVLHNIHLYKSCYSYSFHVSFHFEGGQTKKEPFLSQESFLIRGLLNQMCFPKTLMTQLSEFHFLLTSTHLKLWLHIFMSQKHFYLHKNNNFLGWEEFVVYN